MNEYKYKLASNKYPKLDCPFCGAKKHWQRYFDQNTGNVLPERYGLCDNASKCGLGTNPYKDGYAKATLRNQYEEYKVNNSIIKHRKKIKKQSVNIPNEILNNTLNSKDYDKNIFLQNLLINVPFPFEDKDIERVISQYYLGTIPDGYRAGAVTFPFIDHNNNIRAIQVKQFDSKNHTTATDFLPSIIEKHCQKYKKPLPEWLVGYKKNERKVSCLFGEHLLSKFKTNLIGLVEAPKSAIYSTLYFGFPDNPNNILWLAVYNLSSLNYEKCKNLRGRHVCLFPDLSKDGKSYDLWSKKSKELEKQIPGTKFIMSTLLEDIAGDIARKQGQDIADIIIEQDWRLFRPTNNNEDEHVEYSQGGTEKVELVKVSDVYKYINTEINSSDDILSKLNEIEDKWTKDDVKKINKYFLDHKLPKGPIKLNNFTTIIDTEKFIESHLKAINTNTDFKACNQCLTRIKECLSKLNLLDSIIVDYQCNSP